MEVQQAPLFTIAEIMTTLASQDAESYNDLGRAHCATCCVNTYTSLFILFMKICEVGAGFTSTVQMKKPRLCEGCLATGQSEARD